jgi:hypothetical protein
MIYRPWSFQRCRNREKRPAVLVNHDSLGKLPLTLTTNFQRIIRV